MFTVAGMVARWWLWVGVGAFQVGLVESRELIFWGSLTLIDIFLFGIVYMLIIKKGKRGKSGDFVLNPGVLSAFLIGAGQAAQGEMRWARFLLVSLLPVPFTLGPAIWGAYWWWRMLLLFAGFGGIGDYMSCLLLVGPLVIPGILLMIFNIRDVRWRSEGEKVASLRNNGLLRGFLSLVVPGLGQALWGDYRRAGIYLAVSVCLGVSFLITNPLGLWSEVEGIYLAILGGGVIYNLISAVDALLLDTRNKV